MTPVMVEETINTMEQLLAEDDKYKVVGFDLQYTSGRLGFDQKVAVAQLCVRHHVLVYHYCLATRPCKRFARFVNSPHYKFATVDTTNDLRALKVSDLKCPNLVNIQHHYKVWGSDKSKLNSLVDLASAIIDPYYRDMKAECDKNKPVWHRALVKKLDEYHLQTAAKEAYTCYEMSRRIIDMRKCLLPQDGDGSSRKQSNGKHRNKK